MAPETGLEPVTRRLIPTRRDSSGWVLETMAPETGLEPVTRRLTAGCSTIELLWTPEERRFYKPITEASNGFWLEFRSNLSKLQSKHSEFSPPYLACIGYTY